VRTTVEECGRLGVECVTLYSFSVENWRRPQMEIDGVMAMCLMYVEGEREEFIRERIRFKVLGRREGLPQEVIDAINRTEEATADLGGPTLCIALNYGGRAEIIDAAKAIASKVNQGELDLSKIDEDVISAHLTTAGIPDPDLLVRTAGDQRISNFLLWQLSYAELYFTPVYWPDFTIPELHKAVRSYAQRARRFGGLDSSGTETAAT
jgi:undecaprenyl diphosphate synthase